MRNLALLGARLTVGGYVAAHGAQKLFGAFGGPGLDGAGGFFEHLGLRPGREMATVAAASELTGGALMAAGLLDPLGPVAVASTMAVAAATGHRGKGAFAANGGPELAIGYAAAATALAASGPGRFRLGLQLPNRLAAALVIGAGATAAALVARSRTAPRPQPGDDTTVDLTAEETSTEPDLVPA
jgi:putative oxidoreductase